MDRQNCMHTMLPSEQDALLSSVGSAPALSSSWQDWINDGQRLLVGDMRRAWAVVALWRRRALSRAALARLDARLLADVGLDAARVRAEIQKPFWKA